MTTNGNGDLYGLVAEFEDSTSLLAAARQAREAGYEQVRAYTPYPVEGLVDVLDRNRPNVFAYAVPIGLAAGAFVGYILQSYTSVFTYDLNVGGRPLVSWPAFMLVTFELAILFAALTTVIAFFAQNGLPLPYHPIFNTPGADKISSEGFFLCIETRDRRFDVEQTKTFLEQLDPVNVSEVQH